MEQPLYKKPKSPPTNQPEDQPGSIHSRVNRITQLTKEISELEQVPQSMFIAGLIIEHKKQLAEVQKEHDLSYTRRKDHRDFLANKLADTKEKLQDDLDYEKQWKGVELNDEEKKSLKAVQTKIRALQKQESEFEVLLAKWDSFYEGVE